MNAPASTRKSLEISEVRARLDASAGPDYWRSLDELAQTDEFQEMLHREFPEQASEMSDPVSRRNFLKLMSASLAFGGLSACTIQPPEKIVPFVRAPEYTVPGKPLFYATAASLGGVGTGVLVESHMGRPTKLEGNPEHPASRGRTNAIIQASVLDLYDPDRSQVVRNAGRISTWDSFLRHLDRELETQRQERGGGMRILTETVVSPTLGAQLRSLLEEYPEARWHQYEPAHRDHVLAGARLAFGEAVSTWYDVARAKVILSLDADFANSGPGSIRYAADLAAGRGVRDGDAEMNRLYLVESTPTATGSIADHRLALSSAEIEALALRLADELGVSWSGPAPESSSPDPAGWIGPLVRDLRQNAGSSLVIAGDQQSPAVHALAHALNQALGNVGRTVFHGEPLEVEPVDQRRSIQELVDAMRDDRVDLLIMVGGNPAFSAPADLEFAQALQRVGTRVHMGLHENETSDLSHWHVPETHYLESWSDTRAYDGTTSIVQPVVEPLYGGKSPHELLDALAGRAGRPVYDLVRAHWQQHAADDFEPFWRQSLHDGILPDTALPPGRAILQDPLPLPPETGQPRPDGELELAFRPDPLIWDGRFVNNGWLQETPRPLTKLTWDNAALVSPAAAARLHLDNEQIVELGYQGRAVRAPVWIVPGQARDVVTLHLGYGQRRSGRVGSEAGFDAYALRPSTNPWTGAGVRITATADRYPLACTQDHSSMEGRSLVRRADRAEFSDNPTFAQTGDPPDGLTLYSGFDYPDRAWGMTIDLSACIGCNACTVACQAENNIPIVGKDQVREGREMPWIRVDRYYAGDPDDPEILHQPVPCQQCENAPCELVCPVGATSHTPDGLNHMVYNRCVGTRYCSNNCPYKVRRFNFLQYANRDSESLKLQRNPDVTVRARGVMEKCSYCIQRISTARIEAKKSGQPIRDGQIQTACQQTCPTDAIVFGDINDPDSRVARLKAGPLNYGILTELNTRPRTTYLARVRNPNPEIVRG